MTCYDISCKLFIGKPLYKLKIMKKSEGKGKGGRPVGSVSRLTSKQTKLKNAVLRYMEEHIADAMDVLVTIMKDESVNAQTRVTSAKYVVDKSSELIEKILTPEKDDGASEDSEEKAEVVDIKPRLSLTVPTKKD